MDPLLELVQKILNMEQLFGVVFREIFQPALRGPLASN